MPDVVLTTGVDTSGVASGMASVKNVVEQITNSIGSKLVAAFSLYRVADFLDQTVRKMQNIHDEATRFGVDGEQLQKVALAAQETGIGMNQVARAMNQAQLSGAKVTEGNKEAAAAFKQLNINAYEFNSIPTDKKILAIAEAYEKSNKTANDYAAVAQIIGSRNTELIAAFQDIIKYSGEGSDKIHIFSNEQLRAADETAKLVERLKQLALVDIGGPLVQKLAIVVGGIAKVADALSAVSRWLDKISVIKAAKGSLMDLFLLSGPGSQFLLGKLFPQTGQPTGSPSTLAPPGAAATGGGFTGSSAGSGLSDNDYLERQEALRLQTLSDEQRLNELIAKRAALQQQLDDGMETRNLSNEEEVKLTDEILALDEKIVPLTRQVADQKQREADETERQLILDEKSAAQTDRSIQQSIDRAQIDALRFRAQQEGNFALAQEADLLQTALNFDQQIQRAIDAANDARARGLEITAEENEKLAQQLEIEKEQALAEQRKRQEQERSAAIAAQIRNAAGALAQNNLRLGATSDVYAQALAASRGLKPGTPEYDRLFKQIAAEDILRMLQGRNLSSQDQAARDKLVQWFAGIQAQQASQRGDAARADQLAYWQAIAQGRTPPPGNPYTAFYAAPGGGAASLGPFSALVTNTGITNTLLQQLLTQIQQVNTNTSTVASNTRVVEI